jgi:hypothetical protein
VMERIARRKRATAHAHLWCAGCCEAKRLAQREFCFAKVNEE